MALKIKNSEVDRLATEVAAVFGESKTQAIKVALEERIARAASISQIDEAEPGAV